MRYSWTNILPCKIEQMQLHLYMILTSFLIVFLQKGAIEISTTFGLNSSFADILTGIIIFFIIGSEFFINYTIKVHSSKKGEKKS